MLEQVGHGGIDNRAAGGGKSDFHAAPVAGVRTAADQPALGEPVDPVGHRPAGHQHLCNQLPGGELVWRARSPQRRQNVEPPALQAVLGEG